MYANAQSVEKSDNCTRNNTVEINRTPIATAIFNIVVLDDSEHGENIKV